VLVDDAVGATAFGEGRDGVVGTFTEVASGMGREGAAIAAFDEGILVAAGAAPTLGVDREGVVAAVPCAGGVLAVVAPCAEAVLAVVALYAD
jgi:hypothetical protein